MSFLSKHVIPGNYGKKFTTDASNPEELNKIEEALLKIDGVKFVVFESESIPKIFVIHTDKVVKVKEIENTVKVLNLHAIPIGPFFPLV